MQPSQVKIPPSWYPFFLFLLLMMVFGILDYIQLAFAFCIAGFVSLLYGGWCLERHRRRTPERKDVLSTALSFGLFLVVMTVTCAAWHSIEVQRYKGQWDPFSAAKRGDEEALRVLLGEINLETTDDRGNTPLLLAAKRKQHEMVRLLINMGADVQAQDQKGVSAIAWAERNNDKKLLELLRSEDERTTTNE